MCSYPQMLLLKARLLSIHCVPFRKILHTSGKIPLILFPYFYTNETIIYILCHSCLILLTTF